MAVRHLAEAFISMVAESIHFFNEERLDMNSRHGEIMISFRNLLEEHFMCPDMARIMMFGIIGRSHTSYRVSSGLP